MALPPVIATLTANTSEFVSKMAGARDSWQATADAIADPAPLLVAQRGMSELAATARDAGTAVGTSFTSGSNVAIASVRRMVAANRAALADWIRDTAEMEAAEKAAYIDAAEMAKASADSQVESMSAVRAKAVETGEGIKSSMGAASKFISAVFGVAIGVDLFKSIIDAGETAQQTLDATNAVLKSTGDIAGLTGAQIVAMSDKIGVSVGVTGQTMQAAFNSALTSVPLQEAFKSGAVSASQFAGSIADLASKQGGGTVTADGLNASSLLLAKALSFPATAVGALKKAHVDLTDAQAAQIKAFVKVGDVADAQRVIMDGVTTAVGGQATATVSASGKMSAAFGTLKDDIGKDLLPEFDKVAAFITDTVIPAADQFWGNIISGGGKFAEFRADVESWKASLEKAWTELQPMVVTFFNALVQVGGEFGSLLSLALNALDPILKAIKPLTDQTWLWEDAIVMIGTAWAASKIESMAGTIVALTGKLLALVTANEAVATTAGEAAAAEAAINPVTATLVVGAGLIYGAYKATDAIIGHFNDTTISAKQRVDDLVSTLTPAIQKMQEFQGPTGVASTQLHNIAVEALGVTEKLPGTQNSALNLADVLKNHLGLTADQTRAALQSLGFSAQDANSLIAGTDTTSAVTQYNNLNTAVVNLSASLNALNSVPSPLGTLYGAPIYGPVAPSGPGVVDLGALHGLANAASAATSAASPTGGATTAAGKAVSGLTGNAATIASFLAGKGLTQAQIAGVLGNFQVESGFSPTAYDAKEGAIGIAQWEGGRRTALDAYAKSTGGKETSLQTQLGYLWQELTGSESGSLSALKGQSTAGGAASSFDINFERSAAASRPLRVSDAQALLGKVGATNTSITTGLANIPGAAASTAAATITGKALATLLANQKAHDASLVAALKYKQTFTDVTSLGTSPTAGQAAVLKLQDAAAVAALKAASAQADAATIATAAGAASKAAIKAKATADSLAAKATADQNAADLAADKLAAANVLAQRAADLAAAQKAAADLAAQNAAAVVAARQNALQLAAANQIAANAAVSLFDNGVLNRGADFAQTVAANNAAPNITVNVAGHVTTERDLLASIHEGLLAYGRTNIGTGLN